MLLILAFTSHSISRYGKKYLYNNRREGGGGGGGIVHEDLCKQTIYIRVTVLIIWCGACKCYSQSG